MAIFLLSTSLKGISSRKLAGDLEVKQSTAWLLAHKIRGALEQGSGLFGNPVEADETYIGGLEKNKHENKKKHDGRGAKYKLGRRRWKGLPFSMSLIVPLLLELH